MSGVGRPQAGKSDIPADATHFRKFSKLTFGRTNTERQCFELMRLTLCAGFRRSKNVSLTVPVKQNIRCHPKPE
jgi:hypothetical protein